MINSKFQTPLGYRWGRDILLPYESVWGAVNLFKYLNCIRNTDILIGRPKTGLSHWTASKRLNSDFTVYDFSGDLKDDLYFPEGHFRDGTHEYIMTPNIPQIRTDVWFCPECMKRYAYHSRFHQIYGLGKCFIHKIPLKKTNMPYAIDTYRSDGAYEFGNIHCAEMFGFNGIAKIVRDRRCFRNRILKEGTLRVSIHGMRDSAVDPDQARWDSRPFAVFSDSEDKEQFLRERILKCLKYRSEAEMVFSYTGADIANLMIGVRIAGMEEKYGSDTVNACITEYNTLGPCDEFVSKMKAYPARLARDCLLLLMLFGTDSRFGLSAFRANLTHVKDFYGLSLHINFMKDNVVRYVDSRYNSTKKKKISFSMDGKGNLICKGREYTANVSDAEELCVAVAIAEQYIADLEKIFPDVTTCCRYIRQGISRKRPEPLYKVVTVEDAGRKTIKLYHCVQTRYSV